MTKTYQIDNNCLVVRSGEALPPFCVKTNRKVSKAEYGPRKLKWTKEVKGPKFVKIVYYFMSRQYCDLTFGLSKSVRTKALLFFMAKLAVMFVGMVGMFLGAALLWNQFVILAFVAVGLIAAIMLPFGNLPLAIVREENGFFWLKGCSKEYLKRLQSGR